MNITAFHKYNLDFARISLSNYKSDPYFTIFLHFLALTQMNRWVCERSLREFLTRFFLILDQPIQEIFESYLEDGILVKGCFAENYFQLSLEDILCFTGFSRGGLNFHVWGTLEDFISDYKRIDYDVWAEESTAEGDEDDFFLGETSKDWLHMTCAMNYELYKIPELSLNFKPTLKSLEKSDIESVKRFVDFMMNHIDPDFFVNFDKTQIYEPHTCTYSFTRNDSLMFDPEDYLHPPRILKLMRIVLGAKNPHLAIYRRAFEKEERMPNSLFHFKCIIKFAFGVKYGLIQLSDGPADFHACFDLRFEKGELSSLLQQENLSTKKLFHSKGMETWLYLLP